MSAKDWATYGPIARALLGRTVLSGLPTNSLKLATDKADHRHAYIWVDPPWELLRDGARLVGSAEYPHHEAPDYLERHTAWGAVVWPVLTDAVLTDVRSSVDGTTEFSFAGGVVLKVGTGEPEADGWALWYDDWYAKA